MSVCQKMEVTQMKTEANADIQLEFPSAVLLCYYFLHLYFRAKSSLITDGAMPELCIYIVHDKECIAIYIIKKPHKTCMNII